jgi:two-component system sensor histidine kinase RegB
MLGHQRFASVEILPMKAGRANSPGALHLTPWALLSPIYERFNALQAPAQSASIQETATRKNLLLLVSLRWLAVCGQILTIFIVEAGLDIPVPLLPMGCVIAFLIGLNLVSLYRCHIQATITNAELFAELLLDVGALTIQLYLSGGATNPFVSLFILQAVIGAVLLPPALTWILVTVASFCFVFLTRYYREFDLSAYGQGGYGVLPDFYDLHIYGVFVCFLLVAVLLVFFVTRINGNLRLRDQRLSELRQQAVEDEHIVRMGLLVSGAAHELGTPLTTLSVILNDWERMPALHADLDLDTEIDEMRAALNRCKEIVSRTLLAAGEARGEEAVRTTLAGFLDDVVAEWWETRAPAAHLDYNADIESNIVIASDTVLRQSLLNVFDNALEASPAWVGIYAARTGDHLVVNVRDKGAGFTPGMLANFGKPYESTKNRSGSGLGLFLVVNVFRKLGGAVEARNNPEGGAIVELRLPIEALAIEDGAKHGAG